MPRTDVQAGPTSYPSQSSAQTIWSAAAVGRFRAVVSMHGFRAGGVVGWLAWGFIHLTALTGFLNRFSALFHWLRRIVSKGRSELAYTARFNQARPRTKTT